jgi:hypothetical protein
VGLLLLGRWTVSDPLKSPLANASPAPAKLGHPVWGEIGDYFQPHEFRNPYEMDVEFLRLLYKIRKRAGVPIRITSDARDPEGDIGADKSAHKKRPCRAIDCKVINSYERWRLVWASVLEGVVRLGVYGDKPILHIDAETHTDNPSERIWTSY